MDRYRFSKSLLIIALVTCLFSFSAKAIANSRTIELAGIVFNARDLSPLASADILDGNAKKLGTTDKNGYYHVTINYDQTGELYFEVKIVKEGFQAFVQNEHWGSTGDARNMMYFGLKESHSTTEAFSILDDKKPSDLSYETALDHFSKVKAEKAFDDKLAQAKAGNQDVLVKIDDAFYIVDANGWIKLNSDKDLVSIDNKQVMAASKLNLAIKRKNVKWMSPGDSKEAKFFIYTR